MWPTIATDDVINKRKNAEKKRNISSSLSINIYNTLDIFLHAFKKFSAALSPLWREHIGLCIKMKLIPHFETQRLSICHSFALRKGFRYRGLHQGMADCWQSFSFVSASETVNKSIMHYYWISNHTPKC